MKVYVLLLVYFFHGGLIETQSITTPTYKDCQTAEAFYVFRDHKGTVIKGLVLDHLGEICLEVTE